ncbi:MAG: hypothetical protein PSV22_13210 [Pseudolabrys sp.]|nr:hypothetical protein [Pseudolabrys sp.]
MGLATVNHRKIQTIIALTNGQDIFAAVNELRKCVCCALRSWIGVIMVSSQACSKSKVESMPSDWKRDLLEVFPFSLSN